MKKYMDDRNRLITSYGLKYYSDCEQPFINIDNPSIIAGFSGYLKRQVKLINNSYTVFYRGQNLNYHIVPSIFRPPKHKIDNTLIRKRITAYNELVKETPKLYPNNYRFTVENIDPILQHYGIRTPWIDLVDNIFTALWFAIHTPEKNPNGLIEYKISNNEYGWLYFLIMRNENENLIYRDLRELHSSLSLRLHTQHGISVKRNVKGWNINNISLDNFVIARVRITINKNWFKGNLFNHKYFFPNKKYDDTYSRLRQKKFANLLNKITKKNDLDGLELGSIIEYV